MSLTPTIFSSTDAGAPALSGTVGSLATLLDALLVDGYGTGPSAKAPLGWTRAFSGTNLRAYRNNPVTGTGLYVAVDDTNALYGLMRGYQTMSAVNAGTNPFPDATQQANGSLIPKSSAASSAVRSWWAIGNERSLYLFIDCQNSGQSLAVPIFIGDIDSLVPGDASNFLISAGSMATYTGAFTPVNWLFAAGGNNRLYQSVAARSSGWLARNYGATIISQSAFTVGTTSSSTVAETWGDHGASYPSVINSGILYERGLVAEGAHLPRGKMPGLMVPLHNRPLADLGTLALPIGTSFVTAIAKNFRSRGASSNLDGQVLFLTGEDW